MIIAYKAIINNNYRLLTLTFIITNILILYYLFIKAFIYFTARLFNNGYYTKAFVIFTPYIYIHIIIINSDKYNNLFNY
jgi:hypothetical protein